MQTELCQLYPELERARTSLRSAFFAFMGTMAELTVAEHAVLRISNGSQMEERVRDVAKLTSATKAAWTELEKHWNSARFLMTMGHMAGRKKLLNSGKGSDLRKAS